MLTATPRMHKLIPIRWVQDAAREGCHHPIPRPHAHPKVLPTIDYHTHTENVRCSDSWILSSVVQRLRSDAQVPEPAHRSYKATDLWPHAQLHVQRCLLDQVRGRLLRQMCNHFRQLRCIINSCPHCRSTEPSCWLTAAAPRSRAGGIKWPLTSS